MKKIIVLVLAVLTAFVMAETVCAAEDFFAPAPGSGEEEIDLNSVIEMNFGAIVSEDVLARYREAFEGADVKLKATGSIGSEKACLRFLKSCRFHSLELETERDLYYGDADGFLSLSDIPALTSLTYLENENMDLEYLEPLEDLTNLTVNVDTSRTSLLGKVSSRLAPNLKNLTLNFESFYHLPEQQRGLIFPETVEQVKITVEEEETPGAEAYPAGLVAGLGACCPDALVNGRPVLELAASQIAQGVFTQEAYDIAMADSILYSLYDDLVHDRLQTAGNSGKEYNGKLAILIVRDGIDRTSVEALAAGEDFYEVPADILAENVEEADLVAIVYRELELVGYYYMGNAYRTSTNVAILNPKDRTILEKYNVAVNDPPESIETATINGVSVGGSGYGVFEDEKAVMGIAAKVPAAHASEKDSDSSAQGEDNRKASGLFEGNDGLYRQILEALQSEKYQKAYESMAVGEVIGSGSKGDTAAAVQQLLVDLGRGIAVDGSAGPKTIAALQEVQEIFGMEKSESMDAELFGQLAAMKLLTADEDAAELLLEPVIGESGEEGYSAYLKGCAWEAAGRYFRAKEAFEASGCRDSVSRAEACKQEWPESGEIWRNSSLSKSNMELNIKVNSGSESTGMCFHIYTDDAKLASVLFVSGSGTVNTRLPGGTYRIKDGTGQGWYGITDAFGRNGYYEYMSFDEEAEGMDKYRVKLLSGNKYTITINVSELEEDASAIHSDSADWDSWAN